jgi:hypothetical protein
MTISNHEHESHTDDIDTAKLLTEQDNPTSNGSMPVTRKRKHLNNPAAIPLNLVFRLEQHVNIVQITSSLNVRETKSTKLLESILVATLGD